MPRLWVPEIHSLWARNWNFAASGAAFTASRVANRVAVSTPLRVDSLTVAVMVMLLLWVVCGWSGGLQLEVPDVAGPRARLASASIARPSCFCSSTNSGTGG